MQKFYASVVVNLRSSVLDPAGEATRSASNRLGVEGINKIRIGKYVSIQLEAIDECDAKNKVEVLCDRLLANPVIEDWELQIKPASSLKSSKTL